MEKAKGHCVKYGDNVDTDVIIPARYLAIQDKAELATHAMEDIDQHFHDKIKKGDLLNWQERILDVDPPESMRPKF